MSCPRNKRMFRCDQNRPPARREEGAHLNGYVVLPTGFRNSRDHPLRSKFSKRNSGKTKSANESTATAALLTAIDKPSGTGIPRELGKTFVVAFRLQLSADRGILLHRLLSPLIPLNPRLLRHSKVGKYWSDWKIQTRFFTGSHSKTGEMHGSNSDLPPASWLPGPFFPLSPRPYTIAATRGQDLRHPTPW